MQCSMLRSINPQAKRQQGFTLLEIMVAFTIFAIACGAYLKVLGSSARTIATVEQRQMAQWTARNQLTLALLGQVNPNTGEIFQGPYKFRWQLKRNATDNELVDRLEVSIWMADQQATQVLARLTGFDHAQN